MSPSLLPSQTNVRLLAAACLACMFHSGARAQQSGGNGDSQTRPARLPRAETMSGVPSDAIFIFDGKSTDMLVGPDGASATRPASQADR